MNNRPTETLLMVQIEMVKVYQKVMTLIIKSTGTRSTSETTKEDDFNINA